MYLNFKLVLFWSVSDMDIQRMLNLVREWRIYVEMRLNIMNDLCVEIYYGRSIVCFFLIDYIKVSYFYYYFFVYFFIVM